MVCIMKIQYLLWKSAFREQGRAGENSSRVLLPKGLVYGESLTTPGSQTLPANNDFMGSPCPELYLEAQGPIAAQVGADIGSDVMLNQIKEMWVSFLALYCLCSGSNSGPACELLGFQYPFQL